MPFHGRAALVHWAVLWERIGTNGNGEPVVSDIGVDIPCRWDQTKRVTTTANGTQVVTDATITVDRDVPEGSKVWKGTLSEIPGTSQVPIKDVMEVMTFEKVDDWRGRDSERTITASFSKDSLGSTG